MGHAIILWTLRIPQGVFASISTLSFVFHVRVRFCAGGVPPSFHLTYPIPNRTTRRLSRPTTRIHSPALERVFDRFTAANGKARVIERMDELGRAQPLGRSRPRTRVSAFKTLDVCSLYTPSRLRFCWVVRPQADISIRRFCRWTRVAVKGSRMQMGSLGALCKNAQAKGGTHKEGFLHLPTFLHMHSGGCDASFA